MSFGLSVSFLRSCLCSGWSRSVSRRFVALAVVGERAATRRSAGRATPRTGGKEWLMRTICGLLLGAFVALGLFVAPADAGGKKLPADIKADIAKRFPGSKVLTFFDEPQKHIEVSIQLKGGQKVDVIYATKVTTTHKFSAEEIVVKDVPVAVVNGLEKKFPGAVIKKAEKVINAKKQVILYQLLVTQKAKTFEAHVTPTGALVNEFSVIAQAKAANRWEYVALTEDRTELP